MKLVSSMLYAKLQHGFIPHQTWMVQLNIALTQMCQCHLKCPIYKGNTMIVSCYISYLVNTQKNFTSSISKSNKLSQFLSAHKRTHTDTLYIHTYIHACIYIYIYIYVYIVWRETLALLKFG